MFVSALAILAGCTPEGQVTTLERFGYGWEGFNHRLSHWEVGLTEAPAVEALFAVVGGTSTTGIAPELDAECDPDACQEFPFIDHADVKLGWAEATGPGLQSTVGTADIDTGPAETALVVEADFDRHPSGEVAAVLSYFAIDTDRPIADGSTSCYHPEYGWHPTHVSLRLEDPLVEGSHVTANVVFAFAAGNSLEAERTCIDEVNELAMVHATIGVTFLAGLQSVETQELDQSMSYAYGDGPTHPDPQPDPDPATRPLTLSADDLLGWTAFDFSFHVDDPEGRGAYLRTISVGADVDAMTASGHATNFSPFTQLSAFDYHFIGTAVGLGVGARPTRGTVTQTLPADLDENGDAVPHVYALDAPTSP